MSALTARGKNVKYYICVAISLCFIFLFGKLVQPFAGITPVGISILGIFFGVLIATIVTGETFWPALLGLFGMIVCDFTTAGDLLKTDANGKCVKAGAGDVVNAIALEVGASGVPCKVFLQHTAVPAAASGSD